MGWSSGRILAFHAGDRGSILGRGRAFQCEMLQNLASQPGIPPSIAVGTLIADRVFYKQSVEQIRTDLDFISFYHPCYDIIHLT